MRDKLYIYTCFTQVALIINLILASNLGLAQTLEARVKLEVSEGKVEGTTVTVLSDGQIVNVFEPTKKRVKIELNYQQQYTIRFEKSGYITKDIQIDTRDVPFHMREELLDFAFVLELITSLGIPIVVEDSPQMAVWKYDSDYGLFDFDRIDNSLTLFENKRNTEHENSSN